MLGGPDMHVDQGSTINLTCVSKFNPDPPSDVTWYLNDKEVGYDSPRGGVSVVIEKGKWTTSHLLIQRATSKDSGIYKCAPLNAISATINLHVLRGKNPDAWQTSGSNRLWSHPSTTNFNTNSWTNNLMSPILLRICLPLALLAVMWEARN